MCRSISQWKCCLPLTFLRPEITGGRTILTFMNSTDPQLDEDIRRAPCSCTGGFCAFLSQKGIIEVEEVKEWQKSGMKIEGMTAGSVTVRLTAVASAASWRQKEGTHNDCKKKEKKKQEWVKSFSPWQFTRSSINRRPLTTEFLVVCFSVSLFTLLLMYCIVWLFEILTSMFHWWWDVSRTYVPTHTTLVCNLIHGINSLLHSRPRVAL